MKDRRHFQRRGNDGVVVYLVSIVGVATVGVVIVAIIVVLRERKEAATIVTALVGFLAPTVVGLLAILKEASGRRGIRSRQRKPADEIADEETKS